MRRVSEAIILSAGDLSNHMACRHHTTLDMAVVDGLLKPPAIRDPSLKALQERGLELEKEWLAQFEAEGLTISLPENNKELEKNVDRTLTAMKEGIDIIYQAPLSMQNWMGRADFLKRVETPSRLGSWSYEVIDAKLARQTRGSTILQLCLYSEMVSALQGFMPEYIHVVTPGIDANIYKYRIADFLGYHRHMKDQLRDAIANFKSPTDTYPEPCMFCGICNWWDHCNTQRREDDHLTFVAGLGRGHINELFQRKIDTLEGLSQTPLPLSFRPERGAVETYVRLREQARVQAESRRSGQLVYEELQLESDRGFFSLPQPSPGDIFLDIEGDPYVGTRGLEFLFGWISAATPEKYDGLWALNPADEKIAFQTLIDIVMDRWKEFPDMHIYHFASYEPSALKRLMGKYATREQEVDQLLRAGKFVDLFVITRQAIRAGIETYSLKELEKFHGFERSLDLFTARQYLRIVQRQLERQQNQPLESEAIYAIENYNKEDCLSTMGLRKWLETLRDRMIVKGNEISRPILVDGEAGEDITERLLRIGSMITHLLTGIPEDLLMRNPGEQARWLLANMLDWYRREEKAIWWEFFRLRELSVVEMMEEKAGVGGMIFTGNRIQQGTVVVDEYSYLLQDVELKVDDELRMSGDGLRIGTVMSIDTNGRILRIKKTRSSQDIHPDIVFAFTNVPTKVKEDSVERIARWVLANGIDSPGEYRCGRDLLMNITMRNSNGVVPIQGPPGAGKSHRAAEMIIELIRKGKKVGITALSHKVITGLMHKVIQSAKTQGIHVACIRKVSSDPQVEDPEIREEKDVRTVVAETHGKSYNIIGGTAWLWAREDMRNSVDVMFVDEAGQLSLIDTLAISPAANDLILLGDPQQLQQPQQGSHPEGTEVSALHHILGDHKTIPVDRGIFLDTTWRMHPGICSFVSELFYEDRLHARDNLINQQLIGSTPFAGSGLFFCGVAHRGNQGSSIQEADYIVELIHSLTDGSIQYNDKNNKRRILVHSDIKVITPYNLQVNLLTSKLPTEIQIGTVDKFQGQEAPVIIFSMATSSSADAPRGMEFLYSANRFNVAVSRAKSTFILVASPELLQPDCTTVDQMRLANAFSRFLELAKRVE